MSTLAIDKDRAWIGIAAIALCVEVVFLLHYLRVFPTSDTMSFSRGPLMGAVVYKQRSVLARGKTSLTWVPVANRDSLFLGDTVMTGPNSLVRIKLGAGAGGGELELGPSALVRLDVVSEQQTQVLRLVVNQGRVKVQTGTRNVELALKDSNVSLKPSSEIDVERFVMSSRVQVQLQQGEAQLATGETVRPLQKGKFTSLESLEVNAALELPLVFEEVSPVDSSRIFLNETPSVVSFSWSGKTKEDRLQWSSNPSFDKPNTVSNAEVKLAPGRYYWRVERGKQVSPITSFVLVPPIEYQKISRQLAYLDERSVQVRWRPNRGVEQYKIELSRTADFTSVIQTHQTRLPDWDFGKLEPGRYYWRVQGESPKWGSLPYSQTYSFKVKSRLKAPETREATEIKNKPSKGSWLYRAKGLLAMVMGIFVGTPAYAAADLVFWEFEWDQVPGARGYILQVSETEDFKTKLFNEERAEAVAILALPRRELLYWRVAAIDSDGIVGHYSSARRAAPAQVQPAPVAKTQPSATPEASSYTYSSPVNFSPGYVRLGWGGFYASQTTSGSGFEAKRTGGGVGQLLAAVHFYLGRGEIEIGGSYQYLRFKSTNSVFSSFQGSFAQPQFEGHLYWRFPLAGLSFIAGLYGEKWVDVRRVGLESVVSRNYGYGGLVAGMNFYERIGAGHYVSLDVLADANPFVSPTGFGGGVRLRGGFWAGWVFAELQISGRAYKRNVPNSTQSLTGIETTATLILGLSAATYLQPTDGRL